MPCPGSRLTPWAGPWSTEKYGDALLSGRWEVLPGIGPLYLPRRGRGIGGDVSRGRGPHRSAFTSASACQGILERAAASRPVGGTDGVAGLAGCPPACRSPFHRTLRRVVCEARGVTVPQALDRKHAPWPANGCTPSPWPLSDLCGWPWVARSERRSGRLCCQKDVLWEAEGPAAASVESAREPDAGARSREGSRAHGEKLSHVM